MSLERIFETEMRFSALEYMVSNLYVMLYRATGADKAKIDAAHRQLIEKAGARTFPKLHPRLERCGGFRVSGREFVASLFPMTRRT